MTSFSVDSDSFSELVITQSHNIPILVDFWAEWCAPCRTLAPILEKIIEEWNGKLLLAKINSDTSAALATQFSVRSLPTVILFVDGAPVGQFSGLQTETQIQQFIHTYLGPLSDPVVDRVNTHLADGMSIEDAIEFLSAAVKDDPKSAARVARLCELYIDSGNFASIIALLRTVPRSISEEDSVSRLGYLAEFGEEASKNLDAFERSDPKIHLVKSSQQIIDGQFELGMDVLIEILATRPGQPLVTEVATRLRNVFVILGKDNPLVKRYRSKMSSALH